MPLIVIKCGNWHSCFLASHEFAEMSQTLLDILPKKEGTCSRNIPMDMSCRSVNVTERWLLGSAHRLSTLRRCRGWQSNTCCTELAFAMITSQSNKPHRWFCFVWQHGHLALHHKYEPRRREITRKILQQDTEILHVSAIVWIRMRIWPGCLQSTQCLFWKCLKFQRQIQIFVFNRAQRRDKTR